MKQRTMDEMIAYINQEIGKMDIDRKYKMALLGMVAAIGYKNKMQESSAGPEIIRCKDCKYSDENWRRISVRWLPCMDMRIGSNWYCGSAERRTE